MTDLQLLIERLEKATAPRRELDWAIAEALGEIPEHEIITEGARYGWHRQPNQFSLIRYYDSEGRRSESWGPKPRTSSIDAALTLVPDTHQFRQLAANGFEYGRDNARASLWRATVQPNERQLGEKDGHHESSIPIALCIAALRARQEALLDEGE